MTSERKLAADQGTGGTALPQDVLEVIVGEEEQQECSSSVDQEEPKPPLRIKEEQEERWSSQEGEQLQGLEEADITKFPFTPVPVKSEDDEEKAQSSQLHQRPTKHMETEDVQQPLVFKEEGPPEQQECSSSVDYKEPEAPPHIKEEQEELCISQEGEQLQGLEEADITKFPFTPVPVKSEDDEEEAQSSQLHQRQTQHMKTEADGEDFAGPEPARNLQPETEDQTGASSETEVSDGDWEESTQSGLTSLKHNSTFKKTFSCSECGKRFGRKSHLKPHIRIHTGEKPFSCSVCKKSFSQSGGFRRHMTVHKGEKTFSCSVCNKTFAWRLQIKRHKCLGRQSSQLHQSQTEENRGAEPEPQSSLNSQKHDLRCEESFSCSECGRRFGQKGNLNRHIMTHTGEKPFSCSVCQECFSQRGDLQRHMRTHAGEKPLSCSECGRRFKDRRNLMRHTRTHTGEKPFSCREFTDTHNHPHRREALQLLSLFKIFCTDRRLTETQEDSHRREAVLLHSLQEVFHTEWRCAETHEHPQERRRRKMNDTQLDRQVFCLAATNNYCHCLLEGNFVVFLPEPCVFYAHVAKARD